MLKPSTLKSPKLLSAAKSDTEKIKEVKIAIWGIGSIGSWLLIELLQMGCEYIKILDFDIVEKSDISRHAFYSQNYNEQLKINVWT